MFGLQPSIPPLPRALSFSGKTALVTGANTGIGLSTSIHLARHHISTLIITVRSQSKGESTKSIVLSDPIVKSLPAQPTILIYIADFSDPQSVKSLADKVDSEIPKLNIAVLNAGLVMWEYEAAKATGYEMTFQVNFASTALFSILLLPVLKRSGSVDSPARLTIVGSEAQNNSSFPMSKLPAPLSSQSSTLFAYLNDHAHRRATIYSYGDSKLLIFMWTRELAQHVGKDFPVIINDMTPGMVATDLERNMPSWTAPIMFLIKGWRVRTVDEGAWSVIHAATVLGKESHGEFVQHNMIVTRSKALQYVASSPGKAVEKMMWEETMAMVKQVAPGSVEAAGLK